MGKCTGKCKQIYVDRSGKISQTTCIINGPGHSSDEYKMLNDFDNIYTKVRPFKERRKEPATKKEYGKKQYVYDIFQHTVDDIILQETENEKLSVKSETQHYENTNSEIDKKSV